MLRYQPGLGILGPHDEEDYDSACGVALEWLGTPHRNRIAILGPNGGIDCLHYVAAIMVAANLVPKFQFPYYHHAVGIRDRVNIMEGLFILCCDAAVLDPSEPVTNGDVMIFKSGIITNHAGIIMAANLCESEALSGVRTREVDRYSIDQFQSVLRLRSRGFIREPGTLTRDELYAATGRQEVEV